MKEGRFNYDMYVDIRSLGRQVDWLVGRQEGRREKNKV